ncbi:hypothetical protein [Sulfurimonas paralvinellae]|uniref:Porin n=1 Tax=Sulfurimonas paralvinellae TaxID=317658 RepID=A0A7M1B9K6_9BACT|nr:hypothetical protein [Sulfurimonas paralvinellae]QOP46393.1 hypothetical protein FM071_08855 [Sulfurimonas paralvinellae]
MKKIVLSALAALTLGTVAANAGVTKLYQDENGQVFTKPAEGRTLIETPTSVFSKADKLKFSGLTYIGYKYNDYDKLGDDVTEKSSDSQFEIRRAYFQLKAYLLDDPKSYYRITFDVSKDVTGDEKVRAKYAYLYLNNILPATGVEIGLAHRPWHDYEEHNSWYYRSISKVLVETKRAGDLSNSADFGIMTKTRTKYFEADIGIFNGEGYHKYQRDNGMSFEWRTTAHLLGVSGKDKQESKTYFDASFYGQLNQEHLTVNGSSEDMNFYGLHTVYNQPNFLVAAQYLDSHVNKVGGIASSKAGKGWSVNTEFRMGEEKEYKLLARYDFWTPEANDGDKEYDKKSYIIGAAWKQNRNVEWVANATVKDYDKGILPLTDTTQGADSYNGVDYMLTAEVKF